MWLFTVDGMFTVVSARKNPSDRSSELSPSRVEVRARRRGHLDRLCKRYGLDGEIRKVRGSSCPYRIDVEKREFAQVASQMVADVEYASFKEAAKESRAGHGRGSGFVQLLNEVANSATLRLRSS